MIYFPSCKINLGLNILSRRTDGFHDLESGMLEIPLNDALEMIESSDCEFSSSGLEIPGEGNLCIEAYNLLRNDFKLPEVKMHLHKSVPMGAGLGGGSSDAAFTLKLTNSLFELKLSDEKLENYASKLGSDCAFFIRGGIRFTEGRGEILSPLNIDLKGLWFMVINPGIHVSTKEAFSSVVPDNSRKKVSEILNLPISEWKEQLSNDFEASVFPVYPELKEIKEKLYEQGAVYAAMSGSGSTLFGIFEREPADYEWAQKYDFARKFRM